MTHITFDPEDLAEYVEVCEEVLGEITTRHLSECSLYGDSWPGARLDIRKAQRALLKARHRLAGVDPAFHGLRRGLLPPADPADDIPF